MEYKQDDTDNVKVGDGTGLLLLSQTYFMGVLGQADVVQKQNQAGEADKVPANENILLPHPQTQDPAKRCDPCVESIKGPGYCEKRKHVGPTKIQCQRCAKKLCTNHRVIICQSCADSFEVRRDRDIIDCLKDDQETGELLLSQTLESSHDIAHLLTVLEDKLQSYTRLHIVLFGKTHSILVISYTLNLN